MSDVAEAHRRKRTKKEKGGQITKEGNHGKGPKRKMLRQPLPTIEEASDSEADGQDPEPGMMGM